MLDDVSCVLIGIQERRTTKTDVSKQKLLFTKLTTNQAEYYVKINGANEASSSFVWCSANQLESFVEEVFLLVNFLFKVKKLIFFN